MDSAKESVKGLVLCSPVPLTEPMEADSDATMAKDTEASSAIITERTSTPKTLTSDSSTPCPPSSNPDSSSCGGLSQEKESIDEYRKEEKDDKGVKKRSLREEKMDEDLVKIETKKEKNGVGQTKKLSRPSSTPPSNEGMGVDFVLDDLRRIVF